MGRPHQTRTGYIGGRLPYPRHRWDLANIVGVDETDLWPELLAVRATRSRLAEITAVYPHRSSITPDSWRSLFESAEQHIDILAYSGLFLAENADILRVLTNKAKASINIRIALGDPNSSHVAERGDQEEIGDAMAAKVRNALVLYRPLCGLDGVQLRLHRTVLYNSIYRSDDQLLINQHVYGIPAAHAPVYHLRRTAHAEMFQCYSASFNRVWGNATTID